MSYQRVEEPSVPTLSLLSEAAQVVGRHSPGYRVWGEGNVVFPALLPRGVVQPGYQFRVFANAVF